MKPTEKRYFINRNIRANKVLCIDHNNENKGILYIEEALRLAKEQGLDLVQINKANGKPPTVKICDYGKLKYDESKKQKALAKKQREQIVKVKEIKFRPSTNINDLKIKAKQANAFLDDGNKVKVSITFKGREMSHKEVAYDTLDEFLSMIENTQIEQNPSMEGRSLSVILYKANV